MNREHVKKSFLDWSEGKLASDKKAVVDHHLESCPECQAYFRKMAAALDKPGKTILPKLEADPFLPTRIKALAEEKQKKISLKTQKAIRWNRAIRLSFSAFLLLIAASIGVFLGRELATANTSAEMYSDEDVFSSYYQVFSQQGQLENWESVLEDQNEEQYEN